MPSWGIHIALASKLNQKLNLGDSFIVGNILPDTLNGFMVENISHKLSHSKTHYNFEKVGKPPKSNITKFLDDYQDKLENPLVLGSYIHLLTDNYFNKYTVENHIKIINGQKAVILNNGEIVFDQTPFKLKQQDFGKYGLELSKNKKLGNKIKYSDDMFKQSLDLDYNLTKQDLKLIISKINTIISNETNIKSNYKLFSKQELDNLYSNCLTYLEDILNKGR